MTVAFLKKIVQQDPFEPFIVHCTDGKATEVPRLECLLFSDTGRLLLVYDPSSGISEVIDVALITRVVFKGDVELTFLRN